jgi:hypothetical protein
MVGCLKLKLIIAKLSSFKVNLLTITSTKIGIIEGTNYQ